MVQDCILSYWISKDGKSHLKITGMNTITRTALNLTALLGFTLSCFPGGVERPSLGTEQLYTSSHPAMGTVFTLYLYANSPKNADEISSEVFDEVDRIEYLLSNYRESSELSRINRLAASEPVTTDPETMSFLEDSEHWSRVSDGAFDITVGKLMKLWGFFNKQGHIPSAAELESIRSQVGWEKVRLDRASRRVSFTSPGVELDPGGIGKGFAVDAITRILRNNEVSAAMISAGSSTIGAIGAPPGTQGWRVIVPDPLPNRPQLATVLLRDESLSSASCAEKNFTLNGHVYCHIMDPKTLMPVEGRVQVAVTHPSATASDALSNVIFVLSPRDSVKILERDAPNTRALILTGSPNHLTCTSFRWIGPVAPNRCVSYDRR
jgi:FAD:protein FMN transferase